MGWFDSLRGKSKSAPEDFEQILARYRRGPVDRGFYAAWTVDPSDPAFLSSRTRRSMDRAADAISGFESLVFYDWLARWDPESAKDANRVVLPYEACVIGVVDRETDEPMLLTASKERGLMLHFHDGRTPMPKRHAIWESFAAYCARVRDHALETGRARDPPDEVVPKDWRTDALRGIEADANAKRIYTMVGIVYIGPEGTTPFDGTALIPGKGLVPQQFATQAMMAHHMPIMKARMAAQAAVWSQLSAR